MLGQIEIAVDAHRAPASARAFLARVDDGSLARRGAFYRVVRKENDFAGPAIDVVQGGLLGPVQAVGAVIPHESTRLTGLHHVDGTVSFARAGSANASGRAFFICIGTQPALDAGGVRNADGQGFAAFARVEAGMEVVRAIHDLPTCKDPASGLTAGQLLIDPVRMLRVERS